MPCGVGTGLKFLRAAVRDVGEPPQNGSEPKLFLLIVRQHCFALGPNLS